MMLRPTTAITKAPPISATGNLEGLGPLSPDCVEPATRLGPRHGFLAETQVEKG